MPATLTSVLLKKLFIFFKNPSVQSDIKLFILIDIGKGFVLLDFGNGKYSKWLGEPIALSKMMCKMLVYSKHSFNTDFKQSFSRAR